MKELFRTKFFLYTVLSMINLWFTHLFFLTNGWIEDLYLYSYPINFCIVLFDTSIILIFFIVVTWGCFEASSKLTYFFTFLLSFSNTLYGRFFYIYLPMSAIGQINGLGDNLVLDSIIASIRWTDIYYIITLCLFISSSFFKFRKIKLSKRPLIIILCTPLFSLCGVIFIYSLYHISNSDSRNNNELYKIRIDNLAINPSKLLNSSPNNTIFHSGFIRSSYAELRNIIFPFNINEKQVCIIKNEYSNYLERQTEFKGQNKIENIIFVILESFLSASSDLIIDGKQITPFLDSLKHSKDVYYNGKMHSNITIGESGDGQFIYMTGLLPLRSVLTVGEAKNNTIPALPTILKDSMGISRTEIFVPTSLEMWQQENMNIVYGIDNAFSKYSIKGNKEDLTDESIFNLAIKSTKNTHLPLFSIILSISTHQPYREFIDKSFILNEASLPDSYLKYLNACHYTDTQIKKYITHLKDVGMYNNSLIIITSDHQAHLDAMDMKKRLSEDLPLYIINGDIKESAYTGSCNQLDVFTTVLDILNIDSSWKGLGHTLLNPNYKNSVTEQMYDISELIIRSNYFKNYE